MFAVVAVYPSGRQILVGFGANVQEAEGLVNDCIAHNGEAKIRELGIRFNIELAG